MCPISTVLWCMVTIDLVDLSGSPLSSLMFDGVYGGEPVYVVRKYAVVRPIVMTDTGSLAYLHNDLSIDIPNNKRIRLRGVTDWRSGHFIPSLPMLKKPFFVRDSWTHRVVHVPASPYNSIIESIRFVNIIFPQYLRFIDNYYIYDEKDNICPTLIYGMHLSTSEIAYCDLDDGESEWVVPQDILPWVIGRDEEKEKKDDDDQLPF